MKVTIAEKPSVAREIARVVRATNKKNGLSSTYKCNFLGADNKQ